MSLLWTMPNPFQVGSMCLRQTGRTNPVREKPKILCWNLLLLPWGDHILIEEYKSCRWDKEIFPGTSLIAEKSSMRSENLC
ncbi:hypothetical protein [Nitrosopumilus sp.]|uniref:hypothetical protein n=1 Tax=Nitrosopumilus sp. TaxID=2024843 RepID=UPI003B5C76D5